MSRLEWEDRFWRGWSANTEDRGIFAVRPIATLKKDPDLRYRDDAPAWQWEWQPPTVSGTAKSKEAAQAAGLAASNERLRPPVEWAAHGRWRADGSAAPNQIAVVAPFVLQVQFIYAGRVATASTSNDQHGDWDWAVLRDGVRVADGCTKTAEEAKQAAELAAQAQP
jgi:hypothetical protein